MTLSNISYTRLTNQHITVKKHLIPKDIVGYMGAIQAQDYAMAKLAVGIRLSNATDKSVETAIDKGEILRTHLLRPTWHLVSSDDIYWLLELTAPQIRKSLRGRHRDLELTEPFLSKIYNILEKELRNGNHLTREEIVSHLKNAKISLDDNRASHILMSAELDSIVCSGSVKNKKQTYALLNERVRKTSHLTKDEALERLARRYFSSRCPATLKDFVWWSGLSVSDARRSLEMISNDFIKESIGSEFYWIDRSMPNIGKKGDQVYLLPAFDEFLISYTDRNASIAKENHKHAISQNGIFRPVIVVNGQVAGIWRRTTKKDKVMVDMNPFDPLKGPHLELVKKEIDALGDFWGKKVAIN